ncbi:hypothetical protein DRQ00_08750 [candidate division KSB1 bacterium]|nr:MAG: hypothetical protein DRQ00_08750 [candidate division KSB1 bacterium]
MKKVFALFLLIFISAGISRAQNLPAIDSLIIQGKEQIQQAVNTWNGQKMLAARAFFERLLNDPTYPWLIHYYIGYADRGIVNFYFSQKNKKKAKEFVNDGIQHLKKSVELKDDFGESYALLSSLYGTKIGLSPLLGITLGPKSGRMQQRAFELAPENPRVSLIAGESAYYTPKMWGGGKEKALKHLQKAIEYFQTFKSEKPILPTWGHEEAYAYLGLIQMERKNFAEAKNSFEKALEINPNYGWVKFVLMKELEKKMAKEVKNEDEKN